MNHLLTFGTALPVVCQSLLQTGMRLLIQSSLLLLLGLAAGRAMRRSGPARQLHLYQATLGAVALCALLSLGQSGRISAFYRLALPPAQTFITPASAHAAPALPAAPTPALTAFQSAPGPTTPSMGDLRDARGRQVEVQTLPEASPAAGDSHRSANAFTKFLKTEYAPQISLMGRVYVALAGLWIGITALLLTWLMLCYAGIRRICRRAQPVQDEAVQEQLASLCAEQGVRVPALLVSRDINSVYVAGWWRPAILLPALYTTEFDPVTLSAVLTHEVAHLRSRDGGWIFFTRTLCTLLWMQPLLWWVCRLREQASEEVCDQAVVARGCSPLTYAGCLVTLAERLRPSRLEQVAGSGSVVFRSSLAQRVQKLLNGVWHAAVPVTPRFRAGLALGSALLALLLTLAVSAAPLQTDNSLQSDARLDKKVAITAEGVPLGDLLALMTEKTGVDFSASADLVDNKLVILGPPRPLHDVVSDMAALYNAVWLTATRHDGQPRYILVRDVRTKEYEERLAGDATQRILAKLDEQIQALNETPQQLAKRPSNDPIRQALSNPDTRMATSVLASLAPQQRQQLVDQCWLQVPVGPLNPALQDELEVLFHGKRVDDFNEMVSKQFHGAVIPNPSFTREQMEQQELGFTIHNMSGLPRQATDIIIDMGVPTGLSVNVGQLHADAQFLLPTHGNPYTGQKIAGNAPLPDPKDVQAAQGGAWLDRLQSLVEKTGASVISDYYRSKPVFIPTNADEAASQPALQALDTFCRPTGYLWWNRGKTLLFRKRDWYTQQLYEVPDRWILAISRHLQAEKGVLTLADALSVLQLSTEQIAGLDATLGWPSDRLEMAGLREMLAVIAAMHVDETKPLYTGVIGGDVMPKQVALMPDLTDPMQRGALMSFIQARQKTRISPKDIRPGDFGFIVRSAEGLNNKAATGIDTMIYSGHNSITIGYRIALPLALPDDHSDKTQVEIRS